MAELTLFDILGIILVVMTIVALFAIGGYADCRLDEYCN